MIRMDLSPRLNQQHTLSIAPRMIQSMEILQMPLVELQERIEQELQENPVLELREPKNDDDPFTDPPPVEEDDFNPDGVMKHDPDNADDFGRLEALNRDWDDHFNEDHRPSRAGLDEESDKKHDAMQNMPSRPVSLQEHLAEQLSYLDLTPRQHEIAAYLISHIDENGYLSTPWTDLVRSCGYGVTAEEAEEVLLQLQKLDPPGIAARDLKECLLLQINEETQHPELVRLLILHHLEDIQHNRLPLIQKKANYDIPTIKQAIEQLRQFNPKPGRQFSNESTHYVIPDLIVERTDTGEYEVRLTEDWTPNIHISRRYIELLQNQSVDPKAREYLKKKLQSAKWLMEAIEQRRNTLKKVTQAIIAHQRKFLDLGPEYIEPLKMQDIADVVKVHVTTVSRAVDDKWVQTPRGVFPLKRFFGGGAQNTITGEDVAWETIKQKLLELIGQEDKSNPLSDEDLVEKLQQSGYPVARRTVTKYRKMLNIPSSRQRKDWTLSAR